MNIGEKIFSHHMDPLLGGADHVWSTMARTGTLDSGAFLFHGEIFQAGDESRIC